MTVNFVAPLVTRRPGPEKGTVMTKDDTRGWLKAKIDRARGDKRKISLPYVEILERPLVHEERRPARR
jgi:hypothetical protein